MQRGSQKAEKRIAAGPAEHIVKTAIQFLELAARFVSLQLFEAIGTCAQITRGRALGGIGCNIRRNRFAQFEQAPPVRLHEMQDQRAAVREVASLRACDNRPDTANERKRSGKGTSEYERVEPGGRRLH